GGPGQRLHFLAIVGGEVLDHCLALLDRLAPEHPRGKLVEQPPRIVEDARRRPQSKSADLRADLLRTPFDGQHRNLVDIAQLALAVTLLRKTERLGPTCRDRVQQSQSSAERQEQPRAWHGSDSPLRYGSSTRNRVERRLFVLACVTARPTIGPRR